MLSSKCKYAFRAVLYLAINSSAHNKCNIKGIAIQLKIPKPYLGKILQDLVRKGIISSTKGPHGGFYLTGKNNMHPLIRIIEAVDGLLSFETCGLGLEECSNDCPCPIHYEFKTSRDHLRSLFESKTIGQLSKEIEKSELALVR